MTTAVTPGMETKMLADQTEFQVWKDDARRDDWHTRFVGSDIRQMLGEIERLTQALRLAAKPSGPDSANERRVQDDARLASNVREATIQECAKVVTSSHWGIKSVNEQIAKEVRALSTTGNPNP